jgi:hypothetical protein
MKLFAALADRLLNRIAPLPQTDRPHWLAVAEQSRDTWEADELPNTDCLQCFPEGWEEKLHDAVAFDDDDTQEPAPRPAEARRGGAEPAGTGPLSPVPAGAPLHPAVVIARSLRESGFGIPAAAAEFAAHDLTKFYNLTPKK